MVHQPAIARGISRRALLLCAALALVCLALTACAGQDEEPPAPTATVVATSIEAAAFTDLGPVVWASDIDPVTSEPADRREVFSRDATVIYAVLQTGPLAAGTTLTATWTFNGQPIEGIDVTVTADEARGGGWVEFHLEWNGAALWPVGTLAVEVTASTGESSESSVEIEGT